MDTIEICSLILQKRNKELNLTVENLIHIGNGKEMIEEFISWLT